MIHPLRNSFISLLVLLQLALPLLHAHSGTDNSPCGIHLPSLDLVNMDAVTFNHSIVKSADKLVPSEGIIVVASTGIRHKESLLNNVQNILLFNGDAQYLLPVFEPKINIIPQTSVFYSSFYRNSRSPRAPPTYSIKT